MARGMTPLPSQSFAILCRACGLTGHVGARVAPENCPDCGSGKLRAHRDLFRLTIAHIDCDAFYASVEKRDNPALEDRPVIVGGGRRGVVAAACYIARRFGVRSAMPAWQALKQCPDAVVIRPRMAHYVAISEQIRAKMRALTPLVQPLSIDEAFLDLAGTEKLHRASPAEMLHRLQDEIRREIGITVSVGLSVNKSLAKMASDQDKPDGFFVIGADEARDWLAAQSVSVLYGLGKTTVAKLHALGISTCGDLVDADRQLVISTIGKHATDIINRAKGLDPRPVTPDSATKSLSSETTFETDVSRLSDLEAELEALCQTVSGRLKAKALAGLTVTVKLKTASHRIITRSRTLSAPTNKAYELFETGRVLMRPESEKHRLFRLLGISVSNFSEESAPQIPGLDAASGDRRDKLETAIDRVHDKIGKVALQTGRQFVRKTGRPTDKDR